MGEKLQKMMAGAGYGSRREIERWIDAGRITVNGKRAKLGDRASHEDRILLDGKLVSVAAAGSEPLRALIYHKPEGEICTRKDPKGRPTVFENLPSTPNGRWVAVGRLDYNTSGLLLFTNNGDLANKLMHPSTGLEREYLVRIRGKATEQTLKMVTGKGVEIDGRPAKFERVLPADMAEEGTNHWYKVIIKEGRYREVRRIWDAVGHTVSRLKRVRYGTIKLTRDIKRGTHSKIAPKQLEKLVASAGLQNEFAESLYSSRSDSKAARNSARGRKTKFSSSSSAVGRSSQSRNKSKRASSDETKEFVSHKPKRYTKSKQTSRKSSRSNLKR